MRASAIRIATFTLGAWFAFRFISDWPRGAEASSVTVSDWLLNLSYFGLVPWLAMAILALVSIGQLFRLISIDRISRAHMAFIAFQFIGLYTIAHDFGNAGLIAGSYIILVSISFLMTYLLGVVSGYMLASETVEQASRRTLFWVTLCILPCLAIGGFQLLTGTGRDVGGIPRIYGGTSSPNILAALLLVFLSLLLWSGEAQMTNARKALVAVTIGLFVACFSMAGMGVLVGMFGIFWLISGIKSGRLRFRFSWVFGGLIAVAVILYFADSILAERLAELQSDDNSVTWRTRTWLSYFDLLKDIQFFLVGGGLGFDHLGVDQEPHNEWLRVLLETGVVGLLLFVRTWWVLVRSLFEISRLPDPGLQRRAIGMIAAFGALAVWAMADSVLRTAPSALLLWGVAGILVGASRSYYQRTLRGAPVIVTEAVHVMPAKSGGLPQGLNVARMLDTVKN